MSLLLIPPYAMLVGSQRAALGGAAGDVTAPTLTLPLGLPLGDTSGYLGVTTNEANGTLYYVVTTSATPPTAAQVKAGQNNGGTSAVYAGSQAIGSTGAKTATATGLSSATAYYAYFMHEDASANQSSVSAASTFSTLTTGTSDTSFDTLIAAASVAPTDLRKGYVARFIGALYAGSLWSKIDVMWVLAAHDEQFGRLNWKTPGSFTLAATNSPTFTTDRGFAGNGSTSYLSTGFARSDGVQYTRDDAHLSSYQRTSQNGNEAVSQNNANPGVRIDVGANGDFYRGRLNSTTTIGPTSATGALPRQGILRRNSSSQSSYMIDGAQVIAPTSSTSSAAETGAIIIGGNPALGVLVTDQIAGLSLGAYFDDTESAAFYAAWYAYMVAVGADT